MFIVYNGKHKVNISIKGDTEMLNHPDVDYIFETAKSTFGMTKNDTVFFHLYNPNGLINQMPKCDDFFHRDIFFSGAEVLYGRFSNYNAKWLRKVADKPKSYTRWELNYHIRELEKDIKKGRQVLKELKAAA